MAIRNPYNGVVTLLALVISWSIIAPAASSIPCSSASSSSSIFSSCDSSSDANNIRRPPWNPSIHINNHGYLKQLFRRIPAEIETTPVDNNNDSNNFSLLSTPVVVRQVPGDGDCLFHSLAIALSFTEKGQLMRLDTQRGLQELKQASRKLRRMAVECLASSSCTTKQQKRRKTSLTKKRYKRLFIQGSDSMKTSQLLSTASSQYGITPEEYCELMMQDSYWGGGPEIVALCAVLRRPIHVYELVPLLGEDDDEGEKSDDSDNNGGQQTTQQQRREKTVYNKDRTNNQFCLRLLATFGSPKFDSKAPLHILSADSRFPDVDPHCALKDGNHFLAMFPVDKMRACLRDCYINGGGSNTEGKRTMSDRKQRVRGGDSSAIIGKDDGVVMEADDIDDVAGLTWLFHGEWYDDLPCDIPVRCELDNTPEREGKRCWFSLRSRREIPSKKEKEEENLMSVYRPKSMKRFIGYWINVFVRILAYCGDMI